jgi:uncharacterized protein DUF4157/protein-glutamine gamma-glutamyltransferase-like protein
MSASSDKLASEAGEQLPEKLLDLIQPLAKEDQKDPLQTQTLARESVTDQLPLQKTFGNAAVTHELIQRKESVEVQSETAGNVAGPISETAPAETSPAVATAFIVDDNADALGPGQMKRSDFLAALKVAVCRGAAEALANTEWAARGCPDIERWFSHYGNQSSGYIEKAIRRYAPETAASTSASAYIPAIAARVRRAVTTWANTGEITGVPPGVSLTDGVMGAVSSAVSGAASAVSNAAAGVSSGIASAISGVTNLLFKEGDGGAAEGVDPQAVQNRLGAGQSLDAGVRSRMEQAFGESFSGVEVHTDNNAARVSEDLNARALTVGNHIAFARGEYQPGNPIGDALLAHELTHVLQQRGAGQETQRNDSGSSNTDALEQAADQSAVAAVVSMWGGPNRRLGNAARNAMPRLRSGLKLSRCKGDKKKADPTPAPEPIPADPHAEYEKRIKEAVDKLKGVDFGLCYEGPEQFDTDFWVAEEDPEWGRRLTLKSGKRPSDAIDAMFRNLSKWKVDCAQFVQVAEWYALRHAYGADEFNKRVGSTFYLTVHRSTGIKYKELYSRPNKNVKMTRRSDGREESKSVEDLLKDAPMGSRITWTNKKAPISSAFHNENTIKLGPDSFAAHGFGKAQNIFTRAEVELKLAQAENSAADAAYIAENIFIHQIGYFETP